MLCGQHGRLAGLVGQENLSTTGQRVTFGRLRARVASVGARSAIFNQWSPWQGTHCIQVALACAPIDQVSLQACVAQIGPGRIAQPSPNQRARPKKTCSATYHQPEKTLCQFAVGRLRQQSRSLFVQRCSHGCFVQHKVKPIGATPGQHLACRWMHKRSSL